MQMIHVYSVCLSVFDNLNCWSPVVGTRTPNKTKSGSIPSKTGGAREERWNEKDSERTKLVKEQKSCRVGWMGMSGNGNFRSTLSYFKR